MATAETITIDLNSLPQTENISLPLGDSYRRQWALERDTGTAAAVSLTSVTWTLIVWDKQGGTAKLSKTTTAVWTASGVHVDSAAAGQFSVYVLAADVTALGVGDWYYEVEATFPAGHADFPSLVKTLFKGAFVVRA
jgi:hypothetical protein